jgi:hypothetical protein
MQKPYTWGVRSNDVTVDILLTNHYLGVIADLSPLVGRGDPVDVERRHRDRQGAIQTGAGGIRRDSVGKESRHSTALDPRGGSVLATVWS